MANIKDTLEEFLSYSGENGADVYLPEKPAPYGSRRVLLVSHELSLTGAPMVLLDFARVLSTLGYVSCVASPKNGQMREEFLRNGIPVIVHPELLKGKIVASFSVYFDVVVLNTFLCGHCAKELAGRNPIVIWWFHESEYSYCQTVTDTLPEKLPKNILAVAAGPAAAAAIKAIRTGWPVDEFCYGIKDTRNNAEENNTDSGEKKTRTFVCIGSLEKRKGQDILCQAIKTLPEEVRKKSCFRFAGAVFDSGIQEQLNTLKNRFPDCVKPEGVLNHEDVLRMIRSADCLILPSRADTLPVAATEALMFGKPVLCSDSCGTAGYIRENGGGFIYRTNEPSALAECIEKAISLNPQEMAFLGEEGRKIYERNFSESVFAARAGSLIQKAEVRSLIFRLESTESGRAILEGELPHISGYRHQKNRSERERTALQKELEILKEDNRRIVKEQERAGSELQKTRFELENCQAERNSSNALLKETKFQLDLVHDSECWKLTAPLRMILETAKKLKGWDPALEDRKLREKYQDISGEEKRNQRLLKHRCDVCEEDFPYLSEDELENQKKSYRKLKQKPLISIVVPLYNTDQDYLIEMIQSVRLQSYRKWELCLADGSDDSHSYVEKICLAEAGKDRRIRYRKLERNGGISANTNCALKMASGNYISLLDHDDLLHPCALFETVKSINNQKADMIYTDEATFHVLPADAFNFHLKPDYAPDTLRCNNYICHFLTFSRRLAEKVGEFRTECDGAQDFDMVLRLSEQAERIYHIQRVLYFWRAHPGSTSEDTLTKPYVRKATLRAVNDHLKRTGLRGSAEMAVDWGVLCRIRYQLCGMPLVSVIIPNYEHLETLQRCIDSIIQKTAYPNYEILIIENNSVSPRIFSYYRELEETDSRIRVIPYKEPFNYSSINNFGAQYARGEYLLLLNNDTEIIAEGWIEEMLMFAQRKDVGVVGAKLYYPDDTVQHAGVGIGIGPVAEHLFRKSGRLDPGYFARLLYAQNLSAVTGACMMIRREVWDRVKGLDEEFAVAFNDVDLCMRIRKAGYLIVFTPYAELYHHESLSRGTEDTPEKRKRFSGEIDLFRSRWKQELLAGDPYLNPGFDLRYASTVDLKVLPLWK